MWLTVVGCSGSIPSAHSAASCYLLEADGFRLVVDMGSGGLGALQRYAHLAEVDAVVLSHLHADHFIDMCSFWVARTYSPHALVVVLEYAVHGRAVSTGHAYHNHFVSVITIRDRKVIYWRDYLDPVAVFDAVGWPAQHSCD